MTIVEICNSERAGLVGKLVLYIHVRGCSGLGTYRALLSE